MDQNSSKSLSPVTRDEIEKKKLAKAVMSSMQGDPLPLIKEELRYLIQSRRMADGKGELNVVFSTPKKLELQPADKIKMKRRQEQNKHAARRFREKKRTNEKSLNKEREILMSRNQELRAQVDDLERQVHMYKEWLFDIQLSSTSAVENYPPK